MPHEHRWQGSVIFPYAALQYKQPTQLRSLRDILPRINNGGWHFTYMGGAEKICQKIQSFSHTEAEVIAVFKKHPKEVFTDTDLLIWHPIDESYPQFIRQNIDRFTSIGFILQRH